MLIYGFVYFLRLERTVEEWVSSPEPLDFPTGHLPLSPTVRPRQQTKDNGVCFVLEAVVAEADYSQAKHLIILRKYFVPSCGTNGVIKVENATLLSNVHHSISSLEQHQQLVFSLPNVLVGIFIFLFFSSNIACIHCHGNKQSASIVAWLCGFTYIPLSSEIISENLH